MLVLLEHGASGCSSLQRPFQMGEYAREAFEPLDWFESVQAAGELEE
jgi:hypothetical protein